MNAPAGPAASGKRSAIVAAALVTLLLTLLTGFGLGRVRSHGLFPNIDYLAYHMGGLQVRLGQARHGLYPKPRPAERQIASVMRADPASLEALNRELPPAMQLSLSQTSRYIYPPLLAILVAPLTAWPVAVAGLAWRSVLLLAGVAGLAALYRVLVRRFEVAPRLALAAVLACAATWPFLQALRLGQASLLVFASVALAVGALASGRLVWAGVALGMGALIKVTPGLLLLLFITRARRRVLWVGLLTVAVGTAFTSLFVSPLDFLRFSGPLVANAWQSAGTANNQSLLGMLCHLFLSDAARATLMSGVPPPPLMESLRGIGTAASPLLLAAALAWCFWRASRRGDDPADRALLLEVSAISIVAVAIAPLSLAHLHAASLPAYGLVLGRELSRAGREPGRWALLAAYQVLWLVPTVLLPARLGLWWPARILYGATLIAALVTALLALRRSTFGGPGSARPAPSLAGPR